MFNKTNADQKLKQAFTKYQEEYLNSLPSKEELKKVIAFSPEFEKRKRKNVHKQKKPYYPLISTTGKQVAAILIIVFLSLGTTVMSVKAIREPVKNFIFEMYDEFSKIIFQSEHKEVPTKIEQHWAPIYIPDRYTVLSRAEFKSIMQIEYINKDGDFLLFEQKTINDTAISFYAENNKSEEIAVKSNPGIFFSSNGWNTIIWENGLYCYSILSTESKDTMFKIAESVEIEK